MYRMMNTQYAFLNNKSKLFQQLNELWPEIDILVIAQTAVTGALTNILIPKPKSISIWVISLVVLVIKLLVENLSMFANENDWIL